MASFDVMNRDPAELATIQAVANTVTGFFEMSQERTKWEGRVEALRQTYATYGHSEQVALESNRLKADLARFAIEKSAENGANEDIVKIFELFCSDPHDYLGKAIEVIALNYPSK